MKFVNNGKKNMNISESEFFANNQIYPELHKEIQDFECFKNKLLL